MLSLAAFRLFAFASTNMEHVCVGVAFGPRCARAGKTAKQTHGIRRAERLRYSALCCFAAQTGARVAARVVAQGA